MNVHVVDDGVDVRVHEGVRRKGGRLDLRSREHAQHVGRARVRHGHLDAMGVLVRLLHREVLRELRVTVSPLHAVAHGCDDARDAGFVAKAARADAPHHAAGHLQRYDGQEEHHEEDGRGAGHDLAHVGARGVLVGKRVHVDAVVPLAAHLALARRGLLVGVARLVHGREELLCVCGVKGAPPASLSPQLCHEASSCRGPRPSRQSIRPTINPVKYIATARPRPAGRAGAQPHHI